MVDPIPAWLSELYQATRGAAALWFITEGLAEQPASVEVGPDLETGFRALRFFTHTISIDAFLSSAVASLVARNVEPATTEALRALLQRASQSAHGFHLRDDVSSILSEHIAASESAWRAVVPRTPSELLELVSDRRTFDEFVHALALEREWSDELMPPDGPQGFGGPLDWENTSLPNFLRAMIAVRGANGEDAQPSWKLFAELLYTGKVYE